MGDQVQTKTLTLRQWTPEWAFLAAHKALATLVERTGIQATVRLFADGSGELRIGAQDLPTLRAAGLTPEELYDLVGSRRVDVFEDSEDFVVRQCSGFAGRAL